MNIHECIICPKCNKKFLHESEEVGLPWFCHYCHTYFTWVELTQEWNLDAGYLYGDSIPSAKVDFYEGEPVWYSEEERQEAYNLVTRMHLGISELDDYNDLKETENYALGIGVQ